MSAPRSLDVSFVVPSYNYGRFLEKCIRSALDQEGGYALEVVVVDDASTDDSYEIARAIGDPRVRLFRHETNQGHVKTINEGFALATGRLVARIDSDDFHHAGFLRETVPIFDLFPTVGLVFGDAPLVDAAGVRTGDPAVFHDRRDWRGEAFESLLAKNYITAPTVIARREAWAAALPIPEGLGFSDWYLSLKIARKYELYYRAAELASYRVHGNGLHDRMVRDHSEEKTIERIFAMFDLLGSDGAPRTRAAARALAENKASLVRKYFGAGMDADAKRCAFEALRLDPTIAWRQGDLLRLLLGTIVGRSAYTRAKATFKKAAGVLRRGA